MCVKRGGGAGGLNFSKHVLNKMASVKVRLLAIQRLVRLRGG